jgi:hypothetical protein
MIYKNFDGHITRKHGIIVEGWPLRTFDNPSAIGSQVELNVLLRAWQTDATRFRKMTEDEYMAWMEGRTQGPEPPLATTIPPEVLSPQADTPDTTITSPTNMFNTAFNIISLESAETLQASKPAKRPRKTRSDKGKPRKKPSQVPGANVFHTGTR